jgi:phenylalanyl-tRNA synthetase beta chain
MPGRALEMRFGNMLAGSFGQLATTYTKNWRTNCGVYACQLDFTAITTAMARARKSYSALPQFPSTERDVAFTCPIDMENAAILDFIGRCKLTDLESARLFDIFTDEALEASGRKSMAYKLVFRNKEKTLTDTAVNAAVEKLRNKLATVAGIELR